MWHKLKSRPSAFINQGQCLSTDGLRKAESGFQERPSHLLKVWHNLKARPCAFINWGQRLSTDGLNYKNSKSIQDQ